jgi:predicted Holliday junction resolvase-like endonuclease
MESIIWILIAIGIGIIGFVFGYLITKQRIFEMIKEERKNAVDRSRYVLKGQINEQLAAYFPDFPYRPSEARFLGKPIDFVVFNGLDDNEIKEVVFVEVKTNKSGLSKTEKSLKEAIKNKKVYWDEYRIKNEKK